MASWAAESLILDEPDRGGVIVSRPSTLFHYTTGSGLLGILSTSTIWATELRFLNDAEESVFAREHFVEAVRRVKNPALEPTHLLHEIADEFGRTFSGYKGLVEQELSSFKFPVYVSCFCESASEGQRAGRPNAVNDS